MSVFSINYEDFIKDYLPPDKREPVNVAYLKALLTPLQTVHDDTFLVFKPFIEDRAKNNGQRILMESILNDTFGVTSAPLIYIDNTGDDVKPVDLFNETEGLPPLTLYNQTEAQPPEYFSNESEVTNNRGFIVYVPSAVFASVGQGALETEIDRLRPYATFYTIVQY